MDQLLQDCRAALRGLRSAPGMAAAIIATLALAIGANTLVFSLVNGVLLAPLPFGNASRLVAISERDGPGTYDVSAPDFIDYRRDLHQLDAVAAWQNASVALTGTGGEPIQLTAATVSANWFSLLGVAVEMGRGFSDGEDRAGAPRVVVLSDHLWRTRFGSDPHILGRTVVIAGTPRTIVGVAPPTLRYPESPDLWAPRIFTPAELKPEERGNHQMTVIGRLAPGTSFASARAEVIALTDQFRQEYKEADFNFHYDLSPLRTVVVWGSRAPLLVLLGAVACVLLIACANIANLLLARAVRRAPQIGLRVALGATRRRIVRELLTESLVLGTAGGALGVLLATVGLRVLLAAHPGNLPRLDEVGVSLPVLIFSAAVALVASVLFGIAPGLYASRADITHTLKVGGRGGNRSAGPLRNGFVIAEVTLAAVLLIGAGLLTRTFAELVRVDPGFRAERVVRFEVTLPAQKYTAWADLRRFVDGVVEQVSALPSVQSAGAGFGLPFSGAQARTGIEIAGRPPASPEHPLEAWLQIVTPGVFSTLGIPIRQGRDFARADRPGGVQAVIINEATARQYFPGQNPIGQRLTLSWGSDSAGPKTTVNCGGEVVGIVGDTKRSNLARPADPVVYVPFDQCSLNAITFVARTTSDGSTLLAGARDVAARLDPDVPLFGVGTVAETVRASLAKPALDAWVIDAFAAVALSLALIGIYGVLSYSVRERRHELGVRLALGARGSHIARLVVGDGLRLAAIGLGVGLVAALGASRVLSGLLYGVTPTDLATYIGVALVLLAVAALAAWLPARRAAAVDPIIAIKVD